MLFIQVAGPGCGGEGGGGSYKLRGLGGSYIEMVYVYVPAFWDRFSCRTGGALSRLGISAALRRRVIAG